MSEKELERILETESDETKVQAAITEYLDQKERSRR